MTVHGARRPAILQLGAHGILIVAGLVVVVPFLWIASTSLKTQIAILSGAIEFKPTAANFEELLFSETSDYIGNFLNSLLVATASTALVLAFATMGAYALVRLGVPKWVSFVVLGWAMLVHMVPPIILAGAWFVIFRDTGLINTYAGLIIAHLTLNLPMALWLMLTFVREVPIEIEEAARVDGVPVPTLFLRIVVPLVKPGLVAAGILAFIFSWNEFPVALNVTSSATATVPVAIAKYAQELQIKYGEMAAGAMLSLIPAMIALLVGQRYIVRGLTMGALK
jgi:multiple sugar transport system permease protein